MKPTRRHVLQLTTTGAVSAVLGRLTASPPPPATPIDLAPFCEPFHDDGRYDLTTPWRVGDLGLVSTIHTEPVE